MLADSENKKSKVDSKDALLPSILGYLLHTHVGIDYVPSLHDLKTAWDFVHFEGFLGFKMAMQFIWQGCDAILAAPLVLDLVRFADLAAARGESGSMPHLACFFKQPFRVAEHDLHRQWQLLTDYLDRVRAGRPARHVASSGPETTGCGVAAGPRRHRSPPQSPRRVARRRRSRRPPRERLVARLRAARDLGRRGPAICAPAANTTAVRTAPSPTLATLAALSPGAERQAPLPNDAALPSLAVSQRRTDLLDGLRGHHAHAVVDQRMDEVYRAKIDTASARLVRPRQDRRALAAGGLLSTLIALRCLGVHVRASQGAVAQWFRYWSEGQSLRSGTTSSSASAGPRRRFRSVPDQPRLGRACLRAPADDRTAGRAR